MTTFQIIGLIAVAVLGLYIFYCLYDLGKFNKKKERRRKNKVLRMALLFLAMFAGQDAWATSDFTVTSPNNNNTFRITRTGNTAVSETVDWRVVSLSALEGIHYTGYNGNYYGTVTFGVNVTDMDITISETTPSDENAYKYQNGSTRKYRFEVLDKDGYILATKDRSITTGTSVPTTGAFNEKEITIYTSEVQYSDAGYDQSNNPHYINSSSYYNLNYIAPVAYYTLIGAQLRSTISLDAKEKNNGYQYIQVLINNTTTCDNRSGCSDGDPGNIRLSRYMAGFDHEPSSANTTYAAYTFPVTSQPNNCSTVTNAWDNGVNNKLYTQKFNTNCRATDGRLIIPLDFEKLVVRFNASGGGTDHDEWYAKNVKAHIQAVDNTAPQLFDNIKVSRGRHQKGDIIYVSIPFKEIVSISGSTNRKITTTWGDLAYCEGNGTNVLTFRGEISSTASGTLKITGKSGHIDDLASNNYNWTWTESNPKDLGTTLDADYSWTAADFNSLAANTYEVASKTDLRHLALLVNVAKNPCTGMTFQQTQDIVCDNTYIPIGYEAADTDYAVFSGTYDGQGHTISDITVSRTGNDRADGYVGLFGLVHYNTSSDYGTVKNVVLASSTFTGNVRVGGIVGCNRGGTIQNCRVESTVTINAGHDYADHHGGIVGYNSSAQAKVIGCYSAATVSKNSKNNCKNYGGIVGYNYRGTVKDCLYAGTTVTAASEKGAIVGYSEDNNATFSNNYYTTINLGGVNGSDQDGARQARTVTLGDGVNLSGTQTAYSISGLTAIGTTALSYNNGTTTTTYSGEGQTITLAYNGTIPTAYVFGGFTATAGTFDGNNLTMPANNVTVSLVWSPAWTGSGTEEAPYLITSTDQLDLLAKMVNGQDGYGYSDFANTYFKLGDDIDYGATTAWNNASSIESNFRAIGGFRGSGAYNMFLGHFDGDGKTIRGIRINKSGSNDADGNQGLFGYVGIAGTVTGVTLANTRITGYKSVGGIAGINEGSVSGCTVAADVLVNNITIASQYHGGIVGKNNGGTVSGCTSAATLASTSPSPKSYGAVVGYNSGTIQNCLALDATIHAMDLNYGIITGKNEGGTLTANYYRNCTVGTTTNAVNVGVGTSTGAPADQEGAKSVHSLTLGTDVNATPADVESVEISGITYYTAGSTFTLGYTGTVPANHIVVYSVGTESLSGNTLTMPAADATVSAEIITKWDWLNRQFAAASTDSEDPTLITLTEDYIALATDTYLTIPSGRYVTLDLNGHTLDRNLANAVNNGYVIKVQGTLTLNDSSNPNTGVITGGNNENGGGVFVAVGSFTMTGGAISGNTTNSYGGGVYATGGSFTMTGGTITGNTSSSYGGGVNLSGSGSFTMTGGTITGNAANASGGGVNLSGSSSFTMTGGTITGNTAGSEGGGVNVDSNATFQISGSPVVTGNMRKGLANNVNLDYGSVITVSGALEADAHIGVTMLNNTGVFTTGLSGNGTAANFTSDKSNYGVYLNDSGEAALGHPVRIAGNITNGTVSADPSVAPMGATVTLTVTPDTGYQLHSLTVTTANDTPVPVTNNTFTMPATYVNVTATFVQTEWGYLNTLFASASTDSEHPTIIPLDHDYTAGPTDTYLSIPSGRYVTLDLAGHTLDRNLTSASATGNVIRVYGTLTLNDSSNPSTGTLTGGNTNGGQSGVYISGGTFTMNGGTIAYNTTAYDGCVKVGSQGTFTMNGGTISHNTEINGNYASGVSVYYYSTFIMNGGTISENAGRGVYIGNNSTFNITGGSITNNTVNRNGCGVCIYSGAFNVSGSPVISGNTGHGGENNVYLYTDKVINVTGALTDAARIGVSTETAPTVSDPVVITSGLSGNGTLANFTSDGGYNLDLVNGEVALTATHTVSFHPGNGSGTMETVYVERNTYYTIPACGFTAPEGMMFVGWLASDSHTYRSGQMLYMDEDYTLTAVFHTYHTVTITGDGADNAITEWTWYDTSNNDFRGVGEGSGVRFPDGANLDFYGLPIFITSTPALYFNDDPINGYYLLYNATTDVTISLSGCAINVSGIGCSNGLYAYARNSAEDCYRITSAPAGAVVYLITTFDGNIGNEAIKTCTVTGQTTGNSYNVTIVDHALNSLNCSFTMPDEPVNAYLEIADLYHVNIASTEHGNVSGPSTAFGGDEVTLTVTPDPGYALATLTVTYEDYYYETHTVTTTQGTGANANQYTFTMPPSHVTVSATTTELIAFKLYNEDYLVEGDYLIVYEWRAMNNVVSSDEFQFEAVDVDDDVISTCDAGIIWHIAYNDDLEYWTIYNAAAGKYAGAKDIGGGVCLYEDERYQTWWSFADTPGNGAYNINNQSNSNSGSNSYLRFLSQGFSCYIFNFGYTPSLYKKVETFTKDIKGYTDDESGWYLIASPLYDYVEVNNVEHMQDNTFDLYRFNQDAAAEWENWKAQGDHYHYDLESGTGYLYANSKNVTLTFTGWPYSGNGIVDLTKTEGVSFAGWNLVGNPWSVEATIEKDFYRMNDEGSEIIAATGNTVDAMEGIFVHTDSDYEEMTFTPNSNSTKGRSQSHEPEQIVINLSTLNSKLSTSIIDRAIVRFDSESTLPKLQLFENNAKLYIPQNGKDYAIVNAEGYGEMPVNFKAKENGEYTLTVSTTLNSQLSTLNYLHLIDNLAGADIDLLQTPSYTFTARNNDYASRFKLVFNVLGNGSETEEDFAFISNGNIIVNGTGTLQIIDALGRELTRKNLSTLNSQLSTLNYPSGVYILRLINGENIKTQKIIIK